MRAPGVFPKILGRPWAGGTDSLHSMIYYDRYDVGFFKHNPPHPAARVMPIDAELLRQCSIAVDGILVTSAVDLAAIVSNRQRFLSYRDERLKVPSEPTFETFQEWQTGVPPILIPEDLEKCWLINQSRCTKLDKLVFQLLQTAVERSRTVGQLLEASPSSLHEKLLKYFADLEAKNIISFRLEDLPIRSDESVVLEEERRIRLQGPIPAMDPPLPLKRSPLVILS
jgi:hypothetical protein